MLELITNGRKEMPKYRIVNMETGEVVYTDDDSLAIRRSYEIGYDVEILSSEVFPANAR